MNAAALNGLLVLAASACPSSAIAMGIDPRWTHGLQVQAESLPGETSVNGVQFRITRVIGRDVPVLFRRLVNDWSSGAGVVAPLIIRHDSWTVASRIREGRSEVIQWRPAGSNAELLWSETSLRTAAQKANLPGYLSSTCRWTAPVGGYASGQAFIQLTGACAGQASAVVKDLEGALRRRGWRTERTGAGLRANRGGSAIEAVVMKSDGQMPEQGESMAVIVETRNTHGIRGASK